MSAYRTNSSNDLAFAGGTTFASTGRQSRVEKEVLSLFDGLRDPTLPYLSSFGLPVPDGEEVTQELFLAPLRQMGKPRDNLRRWVFRVAHNLARNGGKRIRDLEASRHSSTSTGGELDTAWNPEERLSAKQRQKRLLAIFRALPEKGRYCLKLRAEGLRYRERATALDMSLGAVSLAWALSQMIDPDGMSHE
jgi:RNA polymerase sigma-70 factor, ECF subfamily